MKSLLLISLTLLMAACSTQAVKTKTTEPVLVEAPSEEVVKDVFVVSYTPTTDEKYANRLDFKDDTNYYLLYLYNSEVLAAGDLVKSLTPGSMARLEFQRGETKSCIQRISSESVKASIPMSGEQCNQFAVFIRNYEQEKEFKEKEIQKSYTFLINKFASEASFLKAQIHTNSMQILETEDPNEKEMLVNANRWLRSLLITFEKNKKETKAFYEKKYKTIFE